MKCKRCSTVTVIYRMVTHSGSKRRGIGDAAEGHAGGCQWLVVDRMLKGAQE